jgi:hypothetical protein
MRYVNIFGLFILFLSTGLTVCYSFRLFLMEYITMCEEVAKITNLHSLEVLERKLLL